MTKPGWVPSKAYNEALGALYGSGKVTPRAAKREAPTCPTEEHEQMVSAKWMDQNGIIFYHIGNGGFRHYLEAVKLKQGGVKAGVPDFCIPVARGGYHGMYCELKRRSGGTLSERQKEWRDILIKEGYYWVEAKGSDDLIAKVKNYMELK
jgi:hypothetical protein